MGEPAKSYWLEEFINPSEPVDAAVGYFLGVPEGETDDDWKYGSD